MDRRSFLQALAVLTACAPRVSGGSSGGLTALGRSKLDRLGIQLYTLRRQMQQDFEGTLATVAGVGYREVEFAGYFNRSPVEVKAVLDRHGLSAPASHMPVTALGEGWRTTLDAARTIGHRYLVVAWIPAEERRTLADYRRVAALFNRAGTEANAAGLRFAYHNHDFEFELLEGETPYDVLLAETDPALVAMELDLYWITKAGRDPLAYIARHPGRFPLLHVKDSAGPPEHRMVDVGAGVIDFGRIFAQRERAGTRHFFVEHDDPADPVATIRASYEYLRRLSF
jgi:sugar phosphate isomerase/epimerase